MMKNWQKYKVLAAAVFLCCGALWAQEEDDPNREIPIQSNWDGEHFTLYSAGDKTFTIAPGLLFPLGLTGADGKALKNNMFIGGVFSLAYSYFITPHIFIGGELQGSFNPTIAKGNMFIVPITVRVGYQLVYKRLEFPLFVSLGGAGQAYKNYTLFGPIVKLTASGYYRFSSAWSFGLNIGGWLVPQFTKDPSKDAAGYFLETSLCARYHF